MLYLSNRRVRGNWKRIPVKNFSRWYSARTSMIEWNVLVLLEHTNPRAINDGIDRDCSCCDCLLHWVSDYQWSNSSRFIRCHILCFCTSEYSIDQGKTLNDRMDKGAAQIELLPWFASNEERNSSCCDGAPASRKEYITRFAWSCMATTAVNRTGAARLLFCFGIGEAPYCPKEY